MAKIDVKCEKSRTHVDAAVLRVPDVEQLEDLQLVQVRVLERPALKRDLPRPWKKRWSSQVGGEGEEGRNSELTHLFQAFSVLERLHFQFLFAKFYKAWHFLRIFNFFLELDFFSERFKND